MLSESMKNCKGCRSCSVCMKLEFDNPYISLCPCMTCLVKAMCNDACFEYKENVDEFIDLKMDLLIRNKEMKK